MWFEGLGPILISLLMMNGFLISFIVILDLIMKYIKKRKQKKVVTPTSEVKHTEEVLKTPHAEKGKLKYELYYIDKMLEEQ